MSDDQSDPSTTPTDLPTQSSWRSQYLQTAVLGALVFIVLPAAYYFVGLQAAVLVMLVFLFLIMYSTQITE